VEYLASLASNNAGAGILFLMETPYYFPALNELGAQIGHVVEAKGFMRPRSLLQVEAVLAKTALAMSELGEFVEAVRTGERANAEEEWADLIIRWLDLGDGLGIDMAAAIRAKMLINEQRPFKHNKLI
jgi:NTP pyrophosphatase (non-canonical NTP hydrolase)